MKNALCLLAAAHGLNGMVLASGLDHIDIHPAEYVARLRKVKEICDPAGVEIIPAGFNVGYGGSLLMHDPNLAAGLPVRDALFVAHNGEARFQPDPVPVLSNGGFEQHDGARDGLQHPRHRAGRSQLQLPRACAAGHVRLARGECRLQFLVCGQGHVEHRNRRGPGRQVVG